MSTVLCACGRGEGREGERGREKKKVSRSSITKRNEVNHTVGQDACIWGEKNSYIWLNMESQTTVGITRRHTCICAVSRVLPVKCFIRCECDVYVAC